jgi:hypothetical protein
VLLKRKRSQNIVPYLTIVMLLATFFYQVPARAAVAAAVARQIAALPPHERLSLSSTSLGTPSIYGAKPAGKTAEEVEEIYYEEV